MQLARMFWLDQGKRYTRKAAEAIITLQIEQRFSKQEIFELYANQIDLGWRGTFNIRGFGQGAEIYLGKDLSQITSGGTIGGLVQRPAVFDHRHPDRQERRNIVLRLMRENGPISDRDCALASGNLRVRRGPSQSLEAHTSSISSTKPCRTCSRTPTSNRVSVYTTLMRLQRPPTPSATAWKRSTSRSETAPLQEPEAAGRRSRWWRSTTYRRVKALAGGRADGMSQLNHVLAKRQPRSIFKCFAAAALARQWATSILTTSTMITDQPTTFWFDGKPYEPSNFEHKTYGDISLHRAGEVGEHRDREDRRDGRLDAVVDIAKRAGMTVSKPLRRSLSVRRGAPAGPSALTRSSPTEATTSSPASCASCVRAKERSSPEQSHRSRRSTRAFPTCHESDGGGAADGTTAASAHGAPPFPAAGKTSTAATADSLVTSSCGGLGRVRRQSRAETEGPLAAPIWADFMKHASEIRASGHEVLPGPRRHRFDRHRPRVRHAFDGELPDAPRGSLHLGDAARRLLSAARRRTASNQRGQLGSRAPRRRRPPKPPARHRFSGDGLVQHRQSRAAARRDVQPRTPPQVQAANPPKSQRRKKKGFSGV
jgi:membrane peptidoglycan carboxypeptidase